MLPVELTVRVPELFGGTEQPLTLHHGLTLLVGPNGTGKTRYLRGLKAALQQPINPRRVRYLSSSRLAQVDLGRADNMGHNYGSPSDNADYGNKGLRDNGYFRNSEGLVGDIHQLSLRFDLQIKVAERLQKLFRRNLIIDWDAGQLNVSFQRSSHAGQPYSSTREASGLLHLVSLMAALYDDEVGVLLIDEPELSLHPQLQSFVLDECKAVAGDPADPRKKLVVLATHAPAMIDLKHPSDLARIVFFTSPEIAPQHVAPDEGLLQNRSLAPLLARIGAQDKDVIFSARPLLLEGISDVSVAAAVARRLELPLGAAGVHLLPVVGKGTLPLAVRLLRLMGKAPVVLADLDAVADGIELGGIAAASPTATATAQKLGHPDVVTLFRTVHSGFCQLVQKAWLDIAPMAALHPYYAQKDDKTTEELAQRRAAMAILLMTEPDTIGQWGGTTAEWTAMRSRLLALLDVLELAGCFVLRRGAIEQYAAAPDVRLSKPEQAEREAASLLERPSVSIRTDYPELVRALEFATDLPDINESELVKSYLRGLAASLLGQLASATEAELQARAQDLLRERAELFDISLHQSESGPTLKIDLRSQLLDVEGFPIFFRDTSNPVTEVNLHIRPRRR